MPQPHHLLEQISQFFMENGKQYSKSARQARLAQREKPQSKTEYIISKISIKISHEDFF